MNERDTIKLNNTALISLHHAPNIIIDTNRKFPNKRQLFRQQKARRNARVHVYFRLFEKKDGAGLMSSIRHVWGCSNEMLMLIPPHTFTEY